MAEIQFNYNTNVGVVENFSTTFFSISVNELMASTDLTITTTEKSAEVNGEMASIYNEINNFAKANPEEKNIYTIASKLQEALLNLRPTYIEKMSFTVSDLTDPTNANLSRSFVFPV